MKEAVDKSCPPCYNKRKTGSRESVMKHPYQAPHAYLTLFAASDLLMSSNDGNNPYWGQDGSIHLPPIPLG